MSVSALKAIACQPGPYRGGGPLYFSNVSGVNSLDKKKSCQQSFNEPDCVCQCDLGDFAIISFNSFFKEIIFEAQFTQITTQCIFPLTLSSI